MSKIFSRFSDDNAAGMTLRAAILFGLSAMVISVFSAAALQDFSKQYAENNSYGVDRVMTGSISKTKRYTLQKSVLSTKPVRVCANLEKDAC